MKTQNIIKYAIAALILTAGTLVAAYIRNDGQYWGSPGFSGACYLVNDSGQTVYVDTYEHRRTSGFAGDFSNFNGTIEVGPYQEVELGTWRFFSCADVNTEVCYEGVYDLDP